MRRILLLVGALALGSLACDSTNPVAPDPPSNNPGGSNSGAFSVVVRADPSSLVTESTTPSLVTVEVRRTSDSQPPADGTTVAVNTSLGNFGQDGAGNPITVKSLNLVGGRAEVSLFPGSQTGTARVIAQVETSSAQVSVPIQEAVTPPFFLSSVEPAVGDANGGVVVVIRGAGFDDPVRVTFADVVAPGAVVLSPTEISVTAPRPKTPVAVGETLTVDVAVTNALDLPTPPTDSLPGAFTYTNGGSVQRPTVLSVDPAGGPNSGGTSVTLAGFGFGNRMRVLFGLRGSAGAFDGLEATVVSTSSTAIVVTSPAATGLGVSLLNRRVDIFVQDLDTGFSTVAISAFKYGNPLLVSGLSPLSGPYTGGTLLVIRGQGFVDPVEVRLGGIAQSSPLVLDGGTQINVTTVGATVRNCVAPASGPVTVINLATGEQGTSSLTFTYTVSSPLFSSLSATQGVEAGGEQVTVSGRDFETPLRVEFNGSPATIVSSSVAGSADTITVRTPAFSGTFDTVPCDDNGDGIMGQRDRPTAVDVRIVNLDTGCDDTATRAFTYQPENTACRGEDGPPRADFTFAATAEQKQKVIFTDASTGGLPDSWLWNFADPDSGGANQSTERNPVHTFTRPGTYSVRLTVTNLAGTDSVVKFVTVVSD